MTDLDPWELEQLARSLAMAPVLGERDRQAVIEALRRLAEVERSNVGTRREGEARARD